MCQPLQSLVMGWRLYIKAWDMYLKFVIDSLYNCRLIKTRLRIKENVITDEGIRLGSENSVKLSANCWYWRKFFNNLFLLFFVCLFLFFVCFCFLFLLLASLDIPQDKHPSGFIGFGDMDWQRSRPICEASWRRFEKLRKSPFKQSCWHQIRQYPFIKVRKLV